jgi:hypothetical protein
MSLGAILTGILAAVPAGAKILEVFQGWFPPKSEGDRAVDRYKKAVDKWREINLSIGEAIKDGKQGRLKEIEKILSGF